MAGHRVLFVAEKLPLPTRGGRDMRVWPQVLAALRQGPVAVFGLHALPPSPPPRAGIEVWRASADSTLTEQRRGPDALQWLRDPRAGPTDQYVSDTSAGELSDVISTFRPDVAVLESVVLHRYIPLLVAAGCRLVVDCHNVEAALEHDLGAATTAHAGLVRREWARRLAVIEADALAAADRIWATSPEDAAGLIEAYRPKAPLTVVPNAVDIDRYTASRGGPFDLVFPASFGSVANRQATQFLMRDVLPLLAGSRLTLAGAQPPAELVAAAAADPRVRVTGVVDDIGPVLASAGAMAIPLRFGSGTRFKALEAFASSLPVVSTATGIGGLDVVDGVHYLHAETADEFAAQLCRLAEASVRAPLVKAARRLVEERYSWATVRDIVLAELLEF